MKELKKLIPYVKGFKLIYVLGMLAVILSQFFNIIGPMIIKTTVDSVIGASPIESGYVARFVGILGGTERLRSALWIVGLVLITNTALRGIFLFCKSYFSVKAAEGMTLRIRESLYDHIQKLPYSYHVKADTGDLIQRCTSDVETIKRFLSIQLVEVVGSLFMLAFIVFTMLSLNVALAFISMSLLPFIFGFSIWFFKRIQKNFKEYDEAEAKLSTVIQENLTGIRVVKAFGGERIELDKFMVKNDDQRSIGFKLMNSFATFWSLQDLFTFVQVGFVVIFGTIFVINKDIELGTMIAFFMYVNMIIWPIRQMGRTLTDMGKATVSISRIDEILQSPIELLTENGKEPSIEGSIEFDSVSFHYDESKPVLNDISFSIKKGETVAIIGSTGSGKSSLVHLLPRLYDYDNGSIKIDGIELKDIDKHWIRKNVGLVLQEPFLYAKNIMENIRLVDPKKEEQSVFSAAKVASIHNDIQSFDKKYETMVGERGVSLSGGQKQRMAIARMVIGETPIVVFDDSLSAVDTETDIQIRRALKERKNKSTTIIISHRISTVAQADHILVMDKGKIIQRGTHNELIAKDGLYKRVYDIQSGYDDELEMI